MSTSNDQDQRDVSFLVLSGSMRSGSLNGSMAGGVKNAIDWVSRFRPQPFHGRHAMVVSASPSMVGGNRGHPATDRVQ